MDHKFLQVLRVAGIVSDAEWEVDWRWDDDLIPQLARVCDAGSMDLEWLNSHPEWLNSHCHGLRFVCQPSPLHELMGDRLVYVRGIPWWGVEEPEKRFLGIASSRIGRSLSEKSAWFRSLRAACVTAAERDEVLLTSQGTTTDRFVRRCEELFGVEVCIVVSSMAKNVRAWFRDEVLQYMPHDSCILISPPLSACTDPESSDLPARKCPSADQALAALSDRLIVLSARRGGNWSQLAQWRACSDRFSPGATLLALGDGTTPNKVRDDLMANGVVGWTLLGTQQGDEVEDASSHEQSHATRTSPSHNPNLNDFLVHCTRRRDGPWPNQSEQAYVDDLILERDAADHSALAALSRIVRMECLLGSSDSIYGDTPVVSFTAVPLDELEQLRVFRPHRGCWDFEPYGICIRKSWIQRQNGKPVRYASRDEWEAMPAQEKLFCHLNLTTTKAGNEIDWTVEQEWRVPGDLDLSMVSTDDAFLFVPTPEEARRIQSKSPWAVIALSGLDRRADG